MSYIRAHSVTKPFDGRGFGAILGAKPIGVPDMKKEFLVIATLLAIAACSKTEPPAPAADPAAQQIVAQPSFINKVWSVAESPQVEIGSLRIFLSDGTMVMASPNSTPAFGSWAYDGGRLTITEEGRDYPVEILALSESEFRIRINGPGEPVDIRFEPAKQEAIASTAAGDAGWTEPPAAVATTAPELRITGTIRRLELEGGLYVIRDADGTQYNPLNLPDEYKSDGLAVDVQARRRDDTASIGMVGPMIEILRIRRRAAAAPTESAASQPSALIGTAWRLDDLAGKGVVAGTQATLEFLPDGRASGNGSCNRFNGVVTLEGDTIRFGGIAATRMACANNAANEQETAYFQALQDAVRYEQDGETLSVFTKGGGEPLRFVATTATARSAGIAPTNRPAGPTPTLTGIWTVVGHHMPGTGALSDDEARSRHGETIRLTTSGATSGSERCRDPDFSSSRVATDAWLASEYKLARASLKPIGSRSQIHVMRITCGGSAWTAFGNVVIELDRDHALAPWDGVFFELKRDRDFRGVGQEPGWQLELRKGSEMRFTYDYGKGTAITPAPKAQLDAASGTASYRAAAGGNDLEVVIVPVRCTDVMSGKQFAATVNVTHNGRPYRGCGEDLATPFQG